MKKLVALSVGFMFLGLIGCSSSKVAKVSQADQIKMSVIETVPSGSQPDWVKDGKDAFIKDGKMYYVAVAEGFGNLEASKRASSASVQTKVAEQVKNTIGVEFGRSLETGAYEESTGGYLKDIFMSTTGKLDISGVVVEGTYSEKIQEVNGAENKVYWRTYSLASIPETTFKELVKKAFDDTSAQVSQNKSAQELLKEAEDRFYNKSTQTTQETSK